MGKDVGGGYRDLSGPLVHDPVGAGCWPAGMPALPGGEAQKKKVILSDTH